MSTTSRHEYGSGAEHMQRASRLLSKLLPSLREHNNGTKQLTAKAKEALALPLATRQTEMRSLLRTYTKLIEKIGAEHDEIIPQFEDEFMRGLEAIERDLKADSILSFEKYTRLRETVEKMVTAVQNAESNVAYFLGSIRNLPDLGDPAANEAGRRATDSLMKAREQLGRLSARVREVRRTMMSVDVEDEGAIS